MTPPRTAARTVGNLALTVCVVLFVLTAISPRPWSALGVVALAIIGVGARIEAAIRDSAGDGS